MSHLWSSGGCNIWPRAAGLTSVMVSGIIRIVAAFGAPSVYRVDSNNALPPRPFQSMSDRGYFCSDFPLMVLWWVPYLAKGTRPALNNCPWDNLNGGYILALGVYSSPTQIMSPLQVISVLVRWKIHLFRSPTYGLLVGAISVQGPDFKKFYLLYL